VAAASLYKADGEAATEEGCPAEGRAFAEAVAGSAERRPAPIHCLDAAATPGGPRAVEVGEADRSDLHRCDPRAVAAAMAEREWQEGAGCVA
jgi:hypothetical protein